MRVCIHRGSHQIGGTCIEVESQGKRIVLDIGLPLDADDPLAVPLPPVRGFDRADESLLGVVITHPHQDHYGLAGRLSKGTEFLMGKAAHSILTTAARFIKGTPRFDKVQYLEDRKPIQVGPFRLTPYLVDHSAYDAYAVLVGADGKRLFYTGDFRAHGRKGRLFESLVAHPPKGVDVLLMEGTTLGREGPGADCPTEESLVYQMRQIMRDTPGMVLVACSGQNIDRLVTIYKAAHRESRLFIIDGYTAHILQATGNLKVPQPNWQTIRVFWPQYLPVRVERTGQFYLADDLKCRRVLAKELAAIASGAVMLFRHSMAAELASPRVACLGSARLIYSLWPGYLEAPSGRHLMAWLKRKGIELVRCHTSGHATPADLQRFAKALAPRMTVPVHCAEPERFRQYFENVQVMEDGQWWEV